VIGVRIIGEGRKNFAGILPNSFALILEIGDGLCYYIIENKIKENER
jgi:hypothetical protein